MLQKRSKAKSVTLGPTKRKHSNNIWLRQLWKYLDFKNNRVKIVRKKRGVGRNLPLWPETIQVMKEMTKSGSLVFTTFKSDTWIRTTATINGNEEPKYTYDNQISTKCLRLMKKVGIQAPEGIGFYTLAERPPQ